MTFLEAALQFAERGWPVFPVRARGKTPLTANGLKAATTNAQIIRDWWQKWPNANIGVPTENFVVVDIDGTDGEKSLAALTAVYGPLPETLTSRTGKGRHLFFAPNGSTIRNDTGRKLGAGIDVRGIGGYVVVPPSLHESGRRYEWISGDAPLAELPAWLAAKLKAPTPSAKTTNGQGKKIPAGQRNATLTSVAGAMRRRGMSEDAILAALREHNQQCCDPPLPENELQTIARSVSRYPTGATRPPQSTSEPPRFSEDALGLRFSGKYADELRYVAGWGRWLRWNGTHWRHDDTLKVFDLARHTCRETAAEIKSSTLASKIAAARTVTAVERLARADRRHAATVEQWDSDPWLLNTPTGTVDLRTGEQREHHRDDCITKCTGAGLAVKGEECPLWLNFLDRVTGRCLDLQAFLQRMAGYCLTGSIREHALFFLYGTGANGKTVFLSTIADLLGEYAKTAPIATFIATGNEQHPTDLAGLCGARLVTAIETEESRRWAESKIKLLTGGDKIAARFMRQDFFEFSPQFKLLIAGNHKPGLRSVDEAIRRRFHLISFNITIPPEERDKDLKEKLRAEWPAILSWAVQGCLSWQEKGLDPPAIVLDATAKYLADEDRLSQWIEERCDVGRACSATAGGLYRSWVSWCESAGEKPGSQKRFSQNLEDRGFDGEHSRAGRLFNGLAPKAAT